jgi:diaminohydroxyphosphoribosylaminopyrimidine deaminase/5-amino-6-(5-phosphoribosylamino)uracil reductase
VRDLGIDHHPVRVVASRNLDLPMSGKLAQTAAQTPLWLCHGPRVSEDLKSAWLGLGAILIECRETAQGLDMRSVMNALGAKGITRVFCEGGGTLAAALLQPDLVDELIGFSAGVVIGSEGRSSIGPLGLTRLASAQRFTLTQTRQIGPDVLHVWNRAP